MGPPTNRCGLAGVIATPLRAREPAQVVRNTAKDAVNKMHKIILLFFIMIPRGKENSPVGSSRPVSIVLLISQSIIM